VDASLDGVLVVVEAPLESLNTARKIHALAAGIGINHVWAILNKVPSAEIAARLRAELGPLPMEVIGCIGLDTELLSSSMEGLVRSSAASRTSIKEAMGHILRAA
jgi:CO dehydrogenase nickel-insertion accessory protein CooC1